MNEKQIALCAAHLHPAVVAMLADLYGVGCPHLTRKEVHAKYRLTYARLDWIMTKVQKMLNNDAL